MKIFVLCGLVLSVLAATVNADGDIDELAEDILDVLFDKKSNTNEAEIENEDVEEEELNRKILADLQSEDKRSLALDIQARMARKQFQADMDEHFKPRLTEILKEALINAKVDDRIREALAGIEGKIEDLTFYCRIQDIPNKPKFVNYFSELLDHFPKTQEHIAERCQVHEAAENA